jgi:dTDP-glucose 4,6-dehydratase
MKKILVTGAMGFVGSHLLEHLLKNTDWEIVTLDRLDTSGNPNRVFDIDCWEEQKHRVRTVFWDLKAQLNDQVIKQLDGPFDFIAHLAAGSHVDRSIDEPMLFFQDNCIGTVNLLEYARLLGKNFSGTEGLRSTVDENGDIDFGDSKFLYFSTDEVFGPAPMDESFIGFKEWDRLNPNNPYAAAKAAAEMAVISYANTYRIPCVMTNTMNIFGERQHPEKFIPLVINKVLNGETVYIHADKTKTQAGKRHYLHARNICAATVWALEHGKTLDGSALQGRYNVVGEVEVDNLALAKLIAEYVREIVPEAPDLKYELVDFHSSRPGHDLRYALDGEHLKSEGFSYPVDFESSLRRMVRWTLENPKWL